MSEQSEQVWQNLHNSLERTASERDAARARVAELEAQVNEIPDLLTIAHMQGAEQAKDQIQALRAQTESLDCRLVGRVAELSGSHCPADKPCDRCVAERRIEELSRAYAVQGLAIEELTAERDCYREALRKLLPEQDPLDAEIVCDYCGATVPFDEAQNEHKEDCPWLMTYGTKDPK
jgi:hypothetical protein